MKKDKIYLACYSTGEYEDFEMHIVFASNDKSRVTKWVEKFNEMHKRWKDHYDQYCDDGHCYDQYCNDIIGRWIMEEHSDKSPRWNMLWDINKAYCDEIELR